MISKHSGFLVIFLVMDINVNWLVTFIICFIAHLVGTMMSLTPSSFIQRSMASFNPSFTQDIKSASVKFSGIEFE